MKALFPLALIALAAPASAQQPARVPPPPAAPAAPRPRPVPTRVVGVSDAGNAILAKQQTTPDPQLSAILRQQRALHDQLVSAVMAPTIDQVRVEALLRQGEALQSQLRARQNDRLLAALKLLPEGDQGPFLRALLAPPTAPK